MNSSPNFDISSLKSEYLDMKRTMYRKFITFLIVLFMVICLVEIFRVILQQRYSSLVHVPILSSFALFGWKFLRHPQDNQDFKGMIYCLVFYLYAISLNYYGNIGYFDTPIDSFYFAYIMSFIERFTTQRIPTLKHRIIYHVLTTIIRVLIVTPNQKSSYIRQFLFLGLNIYLDRDNEKHNSGLFISYFNYKEQLAKFKDLVVQDIPEGIVIVSQNLSKSMFMNNSFREMFKGLDFSHIRNNLDEFFVKDDNSNQEEATRGTFQNLPKPQTTLLNLLETNFLNRNPLPQKMSSNLVLNKTSNQEQSTQEYIFETKIFPIVWDKEPSIAVIFHDVTQQRTILSLQIADAHKDLVIATVSHELRTPLNGMLGMIQIMERKIFDKEFLRYLSICKNSGNLLLGLVNSILDLHQIRSNKLKLNPERVVIKELLKDITCLFELQCKEKGIYLRTQISAKTPYAIFTDKNRLRQIFINLVGNSLKFTSKGGITMAVTEYLESDYLKFSVEDTGIGIKNEDKDKLFQIFGRIENTHSSMNKHGVGLGLTISDRLAKILGKNNDEKGIRFISRYGEGTTFSFLIKKKLGAYFESLNSEGDETESVNSENSVDSAGHKMLTYTTYYSSNAQILQGNSPVVSKTSFKRHTQIPILRKKHAILVVDDNSFNLIVAEHLIQPFGYDVVTAQSGESAIELMIRHNESKAFSPIKMILMDCQMPVMDGYETSRTLKNMMIKKQLSDISIIALTADDSELNQIKCFQAGMCDILVKPLDGNELKKMLKKYVET